MLHVAEQCAGCNKFEEANLTLQRDPDNGFYYCTECWRKIVMSILSQEQDKKIELECRAHKGEQARRSAHMSGTSYDEDSHDSTSHESTHASKSSASFAPTGFRKFIDLVKGVFKPHVAAQDTCQCSHPIVSEDCLDPDDSDACSEWSSDEDSYSSDEESNSFHEDFSHGDSTDYVSSDNGTPDASLDDGFVDPDEKNHHEQESESPRNSFWI